MASTATVTGYDLIADYNPEAETLDDPDEYLVRVADLQVPLVPVYGYELKLGKPLLAAHLSAELVSPPLHALFVVSQSTRYYSDKDTVVPLTIL